MKILFISIYLSCIALFAYRGLKKQEYNWDILPYMAIVLSADDSNLNFVHDQVYTIIKEQAPPADYKLLTDGNIPMRKQAAANANYFAQQLPFYDVKPLYTRSAYYFYKAGIPLSKAVVFPSVISYFFIGVLIFFWSKKYLNFFIALFSCLLLMLSAPLLSVAQISTPDCLSSLILLIAFYFLIETKSLAGISLFLALSIFTRLDNIIPALSVTFLLAFTDKWKEKVSFKKYLLIILLMCGCYFLVSWNARKYGWSLLYYPSFIMRLNPNYDNHLSFSIANYISVAHSQIMTGMFYSDVGLFVLLGLLLFADQKSFQVKNLSFDQLLFITIISTIFFRFILQPIISDRLYIAYYISILILVIKKNGLKSHQEPALITKKIKLF